jgi:hypothetical protein
MSESSRRPPMVDCGPANAVLASASANKSVVMNFI